jgi:hypothetical protein
MLSSYSPNMQNLLNLVYLTHFAAKDGMVKYLFMLHNFYKILLGKEDRM